MINTMKIYENGKLVEVVKRPTLPAIVPVKKRTHGYGVDFAYTPRSVRIARRRNGVGSNQYKTRARDDWKKTLGVLIFFLIMTLVIGRATKVYFDPKPLISPLPTTAMAAEYEATSSAELVTVVEPVKARKFEDERVDKVWNYLSSHNSPLTDFAPYIVEQADSYDIQWTLVAAIAGKESSFGKAIKPGSHNAWGVMDWIIVDGKKTRIIRQFDSWEKGIEYTSKMLSENYRLNMNRGIQEKYCPSVECSSAWVSDVTNFQKEINND